jgi:hypothetical protein
VTKTSKPHKKQEKTPSSLVKQWEKIVKNEQKWQSSHRGSTRVATSKGWKENKKYLTID